MSESSSKQALIRATADKGPIKWSWHELGKLATDTVTVRDIELALQTAELIEDYPHLHRHLPDCLVLVFVPTRTPMHCVIALDEADDFVPVVTVYRPLEQEWTNDWRTRE
jgi:hypothetical protein